MPDLTPAQLLATTAADMQAVANAASPAPWLADPTGTVVAACDLVDDVLPADGPMEVAECYRSVRQDERADNATHIAAWDPTMARAVADWLAAKATKYAAFDAAEQERMVDAGAGMLAPMLKVCAAWWISRGVEPEVCRA